MADDTIKLPCGAVLRRTADRLETWHMECDLFSLHAVNFGFGGIEWKCSIFGFGDGKPNWESTREDAFAWLDARVLALRADLLPPGAIVVRPDAPETREAVANCVGSGLRFSGDTVDRILAALRGVAGG